MQGHQKTLIAWDNVEQIQAYKIDLWSTDVVCLALQVNEEWIECSEEDHGFTDLFDALEQRFRGIPQDWYAQVMQPPFAENRRVLWKR